MTAKTRKARLAEAEDCVNRAHAALLNAWMELEPEDPCYYQVKDMVAEVGGLRHRLTVSRQTKASE